MDAISTLSLRSRRKPGSSFGPSARYFDFVVDGVSLEDSLRAGAEHRVGVLGWGHIEADVARQLLLLDPAPGAGDRHLVYVCSQCGDLGCGADTVEIVREGDFIVWRGFAFENGYDPDMTDFDTYRAVGPFRFGAAQYVDAITKRTHDAR